MPGKTIAICVDGSEVAERAFNYTVEEIYKEQDVIVLIHVPEYDISFSALGSDWQKVCKEVEQKDAHIEEFKCKYMNILRQKGINGRAIKPKGGKAGEVIVETARTEGATHIVMGTRGLGKIQRAFLGSVSQYVLNHTDIPVTIIPGKK